jgi:tetratricopeptide (TPR) repeat protein
MSLFAELKRRNVFRVGIAYVVLAWLLLQVGDTLAPALHLPEWINSALAFFLILGFPLAIFFAWAFEMTPEGLKLEKHVDRDASITPVTGRKLDRTIIVMLVAALAYFVWQSQKAPAPDEIVETSSGQASIAVLPFENMSSDVEQEYFSDGLTEELLNLLAKISELKVTSRTSAFYYKGKDIKLADVGRKLDPDNAAAHALSGDVMISYEQNYAEAKAVFERALELDPNDVDVLYQAGVYYAFIGQPEKALELALKTYERDPLFIPNHATLSYAYNMLGRHQDAEAILRKRIDISPDSFGSYYYLAVPLTLMGRYEEALEVAQKERLDGFRQTTLAIVHWQLGNREESDKALQALLAQQEDGWDWQVVEAHAMRGELDKAFAAMEAAYTNRDVGVQLILGDQLIANLRGDPRYDAIVEKMGIRID